MGRGASERPSARDDLSAQSADEDPVVAAYRQGIDRSLIVENLSLSVEERLANLQRLLELAEELRRAGERAQSP
ncbi:MAG: hypothetical protein V1750_08695 [Acidobacteriota bacterium]